jgi:Arc/MetJ family transcription regulator
MDGSGRRSYDLVMVEKVSLSLDSAILAEARQVAGRRGLSSLVNEALRIKLQHERLRRLLAEMDRELGPVPDAELERARKAWPAGRSRSRRVA